MVNELDDLLRGLADVGASYPCRGTYLAQCVVRSGAGGVWGCLHALGSGSRTIQTGLLYAVFYLCTIPKPPSIVTRFAALHYRLVGVQDGYLPLLPGYFRLTDHDPKHGTSFF